MIQASCETDAKPNAYVMTMSSRTLSQRDNVKRMRRLFQILKIGGLDVNDDECLNSEYEDESLASEKLEISLESDLLECSSVSTAKSNSISSRKVGRKAVWLENVITDMVDKICSSEYLSTNLIFRNTTRARKTAIYTDVMKQLKERLACRGENFPSDVTKTKNRFKKCDAECKKAALTIKTATGIKRFQEEKNFGEWFSQLYSFVKTRDSCTPEMAPEPSCSNRGGKS